MVVRISGKHLASDSDDCGRTSAGSLAACEPIGVNTLKGSLLNDFVSCFAFGIAVAM